MEFTITVQIAGEDVLAGHLYQSVRHGDETASFSYAASYLDNPQAFSLATRYAARSRVIPFDWLTGIARIRGLHARSLGPQSDVASRTVSC